MLQVESIASPLLIHGWRRRGQRWWISAIRDGISDCHRLQSCASNPPPACATKFTKPTHWRWLLFRKFNHRTILWLAIRGRPQYYRSIGACCRQRFCEDFYETIFVMFVFIGRLPTYLWINRRAFPFADVKRIPVGDPIHSILDGWIGSPGGVR